MTDTIARQKTKESIALAAFFQIAEKWELSVPEQLAILGMTSPSTLHKYKNDPLSARVNIDMLDRLSYVLGIFKDLQILLSDAKSADSWIKKPNSAQPFNGRSALDVMCAGKIVNLIQVRQYLAAQRGA
jgi:hypothetical protein